MTKYRFQIPIHQVFEPKQLEVQHALEACPCGLKMTQAAKDQLESSHGQLRLLYIEGQPTLFSADEVKPESRNRFLRAGMGNKYRFQTSEDQACEVGFGNVQSARNHKLACSKLTKS